MRSLAVSAVLIGLLLVLAHGCDGGGGGKGGGGLPGLACGDQVSRTLKGTGLVTPNFSSSQSVAFYNVDMPEGVSAITLTVVSTAGDANLHLASPGTPKGDTNPANYILSSQAAAPLNTDSLRISLVGIEGPGFSVSSPTLQDYANGGGGISLAVWAVESPSTFDLQITCENYLTIPCGLDVNGSVPGSGTAPPDFAAGTEVHFFEVQGLPVAPGSVSILATSIAGDVNLYIGRPGLTAPSGDILDYIFSSTAPENASRSDLIIVDDTGLHDVFGGTNPTVTLQDYLFNGGTLWFAVAGLAPANEYDLRVSCSDVEPISCGDTLNSAVNGSSLSPPDLANPLDVRFFRLDPLPPTATSVTFTLTSSSGDADLHLAAPGVAPGSTVWTDYVFSSEERSPSGQDEITIDLLGLQDGSGGTSTAATLDDYLQGAVPLGLAVAGYAPLTNATLSVSCVAPPQVFPMDCGGAVSGTVTGSGRTFPDLSDLGENIWYELTGIPPGTSRIEISLAIAAGDADLWMAGPGVVPGSQSLGSYLVSSESSFSDDFIVLCSTGATSIFGSQSSPTIGDYIGASENLSFVVSGIDPLSTFDLTVTCASGPAQMTATVLACGGSASGQVSGSSRFPPDLSNPTEVQFFETAVPPGSQVIVIDLGSSGGGNADLYLAAPGSTPGSTCNADYIISSALLFGSDSLIISPCGISHPFFSIPFPNISDFEAAGSISYAVAGYAASTNFTIDVTCGSAPNPVRPMDCGGTATDTVLGGSSFANPNVSHIYEIPLASVQGASSIRMEADVGFADADMFLALPGVIPGSICNSDYPYRTWSFSNPDWIQIDTSGFSSADGTFLPFVTIADYQAASTNLSFVVQGFVTTNYTLRVICN